MVEVVFFSPLLSDAYGKLDIKQIGYGNPPMGIACISSYLKKKQSFCQGNRFKFIKTAI